MEFLLYLMGCVTVFMMGYLLGLSNPRPAKIERKPKSTGHKKHSTPKLRPGVTVNTDQKFWRSEKCSEYEK